ncbi:MAG: hypothetical protein RIQ46_1037 [Pseudomonadota bacterium]|jgi:uncharacterized protein (DUF1330 family)
MTVSAYMIVKLAFHELGWAKDYMANVPAMVSAYGGDYVARSTAVEWIEGQGPLPDQVVILRFPSLEVIRRFMADPAYAPYRDARIAATTTEILAIEA